MRGLSGRLVASYIGVTLVVVVLVEAFVLCFQIAPAAEGDQLQARLHNLLSQTATSYARQLARRFPGGVPAGTMLGLPGRPAQPGRAARAAADGRLLVPAITG